MQNAGRFAELLLWKHPGLPVDHRLGNHKAGYKSVWIMEKYGILLMPKLHEHLNLRPYEAAVPMEVELADELRAARYAVSGWSLINCSIRRQPGRLDCHRAESFSRTAGFFSLDWLFLVGRYN